MRGDFSSKTASARQAVRTFGQERGDCQVSRMPSAMRPLVPSAPPSLFLHASRSPLTPRTLEQPGVIHRRPCRTDSGSRTRRQIGAGDRRASMRVLVALRRWSGLSRERPVGTATVSPRRAVDINITAASTGTRSISARLCVKGGQGSRHSARSGRRGPGLVEATFLQVGLGARARGRDSEYAQGFPVSPARGPCTRKPVCAPAWLPGRGRPPVR